jgi:NTP pyrophosphatase (non-canonical NTP hydrolase)
VTILDDLEDGIVAWEELWGEHSLERWMLAIAEEAGEVIGAFNKWHNGYRTKPKTRDDVLEEMSQLMCCLLLTASRLEVFPGEMLALTADFFQDKAQQIRTIRRDDERAQS